VIRNPVDPQKLEHLADLATEPSEPSRPVLFVGRLEPQKDVECLVDAFHLLVTENPEFGPDLWIIGEGSNREALERRARAGPAKEKIVFRGHRSYADTLRAIRGALLLVLPSRYPKTMLSVWQCRGGPD
jgi:glycosyltransferase involved in cell wall biosynthesis